MIQAYILIQTEVGRAFEVAKAVEGVAGVIQAQDVTGPYDVIVRAEADDMERLGQLVIGPVQAINGITRTLTCPVVRL